MAETINTDAPAYIVDGVLTDGEAWVPLITNVLTSDAAVVTFQSSTGANDWSQYLDLVLVTYSRASVSATWDGMKLHFNNDSTAANYPAERLDGDGSSVTAAAYTTTGVWITSMGNTAGANEFAVSVQQIFDINSGKYKSVIGSEAQDSNGDGTVGLRGTTWKSQAPISEIDINAGTGDLMAGSRFDLFGVLPRMVTA